MRTKPEPRCFSGSASFRALIVLNDQTSCLAVKEAITVEKSMRKKPIQPARRIAYGRPRTPAPMSVVAIVTDACCHDGPTVGTVISTWRVRWTRSVCSVMEAELCSGSALKSNLLETVSSDSRKSVLTVFASASSSWFEKGNDIGRETRFFDGDIRSLEARAERDVSGD